MMRIILPLLLVVSLLLTLTSEASATPNDLDQTPPVGPQERGCGARGLVIDGVAGLRAMGAIGNDAMTAEADVAIKSAVLSCGGTYLLRAPDMAPRTRARSIVGLSARLIAPIVRSLVMTRLGND